MWKANLISSLVGFKKKKVMERKKIYNEIYSQYKNLKMTISVSGMTVCMITFWIMKILFRSIVLSISRTNAVSIKVL